MCFYDQYRFACGDWKWGNFRQHCHKEYRMGETCGMKLVYQTAQQPTKCRYCEKVDTKLRKRQAEADRITRWQREGKNPASIEKSLDTITQLDNDVQQLWAEISARRQTLGWQSSRESIQHHSMPSPAYARSNAYAGLPSPAPSAKIRHNLARKVATYKRRHGLPVTFHKLKAPATVLASPDTGSSVNAISLDLARLLGFTVYPHINGKKVQMPNKACISSCGCILTVCTLNATTTTKPESHLSIIFVFERLVEPFLIMGRNFLDISGTMSKHTSRLVTRSFTPTSYSCIRFMGNATQFLSCSLNGTSVNVFPDTGSELDLVSKRYAERYPISKSTKWVKFADGTLHKTCGFIDGQLCVGAEAPEFEKGYHVGHEVEHKESAIEEETVSPNKFKPAYNAAREGLQHTFRRVINVKLHVLEDLFTDVLIGEDSLNALRPHQLNRDDFVQGPKDALQPHSMNRIVDLTGSIEHIFERLKIEMRRAMGYERQTAVDEEAQNSVVAPLQQIDQDLTEDQRENARREAEGGRIAGLNGTEKQQAETDEAERRRRYEEERQRREQRNGPLPPRRGPLRDYGGS